eukprot:1478349-Pleurochrysis_carterae.AAC.1
MTLVVGTLVLLNYAHRPSRFVLEGGCACAQQTPASCKDARSQRGSSLERRSCSRQTPPHERRDTTHCASSSSIPLCRKP